MVAPLSSVLHSISLIINTIFVIEASRERHSSENRCHLLTHTVALCLSNFILVFHQITLLDNPFEYMRTALVTQQSTFATQVIWAVGVVLAISRYMALAIISLSRMVAQTFNLDMQIKVWSGRVCAFAIFVQFAFPIAYVCAFLIDRPQLSLVMDKDTINVQWGNTELHEQFKDMCCTIVVVLFVISFIAYSVIFFKKVFLRKRRRRNAAARDIEWIVHAIRSDPESEDSSEVIPHHPTVAPYFIYREIHFTIISFISVCIYLYQWLIIKDHLSSPPPPGVWSVTSFCMPLMLLIYWTLPHIRRHLLYLIAKSPKLNKLVNFLNSLIPFNTLCPCLHSRVNEGPMTLQMERARHSIAVPNGTPYRRTRQQQSRSRSEDLGTARIRIATIYMNNER